jgi:hypothetical protein
MKKPYADEYDASVEHQFWGESSFRVAYVRKNTYNEYTTIDLSRVGNFTVLTQVTVQVRDFVNGVTGSQTLTLMDLAPGSQSGNVITNMPDGHYAYDTMQFAFNKRFRTGLFVQASYDYQWRNELRGGGGPGSSVGSSNTLANPTTSPLSTDMLSVGFFNNANPAVANRQENTNWQARLIGRYSFKYDIGVAANFRIQSGFNYARLWTGSLPRAGTFRVYSENIENNRSDTASILDFRFDKAFNVGKYRFTAMADLFNAANSNAVTNFVLVNGANYNKINATLDPRTFQIGLRFDF